MKTSKTCRF